MEAYRVIKQIGKGSYGQVFLVKHNGIKKQVWPRGFIGLKSAILFLRGIAEYGTCAVYLTAVCRKEDQVNGQ